MKPTISKTNNGYYLLRNLKQFVIKELPMVGKLFFKLWKHDAFYYFGQKKHVL